MRVFIYTIFAILFLPLSSAFALGRDVVEGPVTSQVIGVLDGDTVSVRAHIWIGTSIETSVRIKGIDTPEIHGKCQKERDMAAAARDEIMRLLGEDGRIRISNIRYEKYAGRVLAEAQTVDGVDIARHMIEKGFARPYHGEHRGSWCDATDAGPQVLP